MLRRLGSWSIRLAPALVVAALLGGAAPTFVAASGSPDLIDVVSLPGTSSSAQAVSVVPMLSDAGGTATLGAAIALPTAASGAQNALTMSGSASSEGSLNVSGNGQYLTLEGYAATPGTTSVASGSSKRVTGLIDGSGHIDTSTALGIFSGNNARSAVTNDGSRVWVGGAGSGDSPKTGVYSTTVGATSATGIVTPSPTGVRDLVIAGGNLYYSTTTTVTPGIYKVGSGLPTSATTSTPLVTGASLDPYGFALVQLGAGPGVDTLYVADGTAGGITKYSLSGSSWVSRGTVGAGTKLFGLAAKVENGGVQLYATTSNVVAGNTLVSFFDSSGAGAQISSGALTTVATAANGTTFRGVAFAPTGQTLGVALPTISLADTALSRAIGDSYDPTQTTATISDPVFDAGSLTMTASSDNPAVVPSVTVSGSGTTRTLTIASNDQVGLANITVTVSTPDGRSSSAILQYGVSGPAPDSTSNFLSDFSDASTAIDAGSGYYLVGDDEFNQIALYHGGVSGPPVQTWNFDSQMGVADSSQIDIEASAQLGNTIYWFGSEGNNSSGQTKPNRAILFATTITGSGASTQLTFDGFYKNLRNDLIAWDEANGNRFGFAAGAADGQLAKEINGFNIEGAEFATGGSSTLYLGFRAPIVPTTNRTQALVVPLTNLLSLISQTGDVGSGSFGTPILWNLTPPGYVNGNGDPSALGVREIRKNADDQYLIIAGSYEEVPPAPNGGAEFLYTWDGNPAHQPVLTNTVLPTPDEGSWETIVAVPDPLTDGSALTMIQDDGDNDYYNTGQENKDLAAGLQKDRADVLHVALPGQTVAFTSTPASPAFIGTTFTVSATGGASGNPVVLSIDSTSSAGACTISGATVALTGPGTCVVDADQAGTFQYTAGHASQSFVTTPLPLNAGTTSCNGTYSGTGQSVVVPAGASCTLLAGTQISGNVQVQQGGSLDDRGAVVGGNVQADKATFVDVAGGSIHGNLQVQGVTGGPDTLCNASVGGDVQVQNNGPGAALNIGTCGGLTIGGNLQVQNNAGAVTVTGNTANGNVQVHNNTAGGALTANTAGGNCQLQNNSPAIVGSANGAGHQNSCNASG